MVERRLNILQVSTADELGGAERVAWNLFSSFRGRGHRSALAVGRKRTKDSDVFLLPHEQAASGWSRFWWRAHRALQPVYGRRPVRKAICRVAHALAAPRGWLAARRGLEDFEYPGTWRLLDAAPFRPDVLHLHNLHGHYFDLRALEPLSRRVPTILTLHDAWLLAGHCAHSFDCERWRTGCGACPHLTIYPAVRRDATAENWRRKAAIYAESRLYVATPCRWLMAKVEQSMLAQAVVEGRVIPNGVDLDVFRAGDRAAERAGLGLDPCAQVVLFSGYGAMNNPWKDFATMREAVRLVARSSHVARLVFIVLGETGRSKSFDGAEVIFVPFVRRPDDVAAYCRAADVYLHASRADTFPNSVLEALACGTPVIATAVGGIPEQVISHPSPASTGILVPPADAPRLAGALSLLLAREPLRRAMGERAARDARRRFDLERQVDAYLDWYAGIVDARWKATSPRRLAATAV